MIEVRILSAADDGLLRNVADGVFDFAVEPHLTAEFLADPRHHLVVAVDHDLVVGMASAVHYVHLHVHLVPRYLDDPAPGKPLPWEPKPVAQSEFDRQVQLLTEVARLMPIISPAPTTPDSN